MRRYILKSAGEGLEPVLETGEVPEPKENEVRVRVAACALNYRDLLLCRGQSAAAAGDGVVPLSDGAGTVEALGSGVTGLEVGDRVAGCFFPDWQEGRFDLSYHRNALGGTADGMLAEQVVLPGSGVVRIPDHLELAEAACLPCAALTAWYALVERGGLQAGETVLVLGTGGVSIWALQIATAMGAKVVVTSSSDEKLARARELGAWETVNYRSYTEWDRKVWEATEKRGVDHIVEVGGPGTLGGSMRCIAAGGNLALIGVLTGKGPPAESLFPLIARNVRLNGIYVGHRAAFLRLNAFLEEKQLRPVIDRTFDFSEVPDAYRYLASGAHFGKVVVRVAREGA